MNASIISALAGLIGAAIGGLTSGLAAWFAQKTQAHLQWLVHERGRRQDLYKEFIEAASQCYADALLHEKPEIPAFVQLYAKIGRMRLLSSPSVIATAEQIGRKISGTYLEPNKTFPEVHGPVPVRTLAHAGRLMREARQLGQCGVKVSEPVLDYSRLLARVREVVKERGKTTNEHHDKN